MKNMSQIRSNWMHVGAVQTVIGLFPKRKRKKKYCSNQVINMFPSHHVQMPPINEILTNIYTLFGIFSPNLITLFRPPSRIMI